MSVIFADQEIPGANFEDIFETCWLLLSLVILAFTYILSKYFFVVAVVYLLAVHIFFLHFNF